MWLFSMRTRYAEADERKRLFKIKRLINKSEFAKALEVIDQRLEDTKPIRITMRQGNNFLQTAVRNSQLKEKPKVNPIIVQIMENY